MDRMTSITVLLGNIATLAAMRARKAPLWAQTAMLLLTLPTVINLTMDLAEAKPACRHK